ncbi:hypothetical protein PO909_011229 [Leuciscus waleckii]
MAAGAAGSGMALEHYAGGSLRPHGPAHRVCRPGPAGRPAVGGSEPRPEVCSEHEARQTTVLRPREDSSVPHLFISAVLIHVIYCHLLCAWFSV